jgi:hypothetical protein
MHVLLASCSLERTLQCVRLRVPSTLDIDFIEAYIRHPSLAFRSRSFLLITFATNSPLLTVRIPPLSLDTPPLSPERSNRGRLDDDTAVLSTPPRIAHDVDVPPMPLSEIPFDSAEAVRILIGPKLYSKYLCWQSTIGNPKEADHYETPERAMQWRAEQPFRRI